MSIIYDLVCWVFPKPCAKLHQASSKLDQSIERLNTAADGLTETIRGANGTYQPPRIRRGHYERASDVRSRAEEQQPREHSA